MSSHVSRTGTDSFTLVELPAASPAEPAAPGTPRPRPEDAEAVPTAETTAARPAAEAEPGSETAAAAEPRQQPPKKKRRRRRGGFIWRWDAPSWGVSLLVHAAVLLALALMAVGGTVREMLGSIDASTVDASDAEELTPIDTLITDADREQAVGDPTSTLDPGTPPSATPVLGGVTAEVSETRSLVEAGLLTVAVPALSTSMLPSPDRVDEKLDVGRQIRGDVGRPTTDYGEALDQLAREILGHLATSRVTVLWMFDESGSMRDDQRAIRDKFERVAGELKLRVPEDRRLAGDLEHAIIGFGKEIHFEASRPRSDPDEIRRAIDSLPVDQTGEEQTMKAIVEAIRRYDRIVEKDRKLLLVLITDESGDDGDLVEQARQVLYNRGVMTYVLGRQAMFGYDTVRLRYVDPVTKDVYWPAIRRGPEAPGLELPQWDGLHKERHDEQPSGFAPYELARLVQETGGIYFLLPNEEELRNRPRGEKAYAYDTLREFVPDYGPRPEYAAKVGQSELRRTMSEIIQLTGANFGFERHFPVKPPELVAKVNREVPKVDVQLRALLEVEKRLRGLEPNRDKEANRRWQANYDLMLAMIVAFQVKAYEYRACLQEMTALAQQGRLVPKNPPIPEKRRTDWVINHSAKKKAPAAETDKKYAEATRLLELVVERHPDTPWADLARTTLSRGLGCDWSEWNVHPDYDKRAKLVPKF